MPGNVTGWNQITQGKIATAVWLNLDAAFGGWFTLIIFAVIQILVLMRTKNIVVTTSVGIFLYAIIAGSYVIPGDVTTTIFGPTQFKALTLIMVLEMAGTLYFLFFKNPQY